MIELIWHEKKVMIEVKSEMKDVSKKVADIVMKDARRILIQKATTTTERGLKDQFSVQKSKFKDGGFLVYCQGPKRWRPPYHASFMEMGAWIHPYGNKKRAKVRLDPKPFMRPAMRKNKRKANRMYQDALDKL